MANELTQTIERLRRATTNRDVLFVLDECEKLMRAQRQPAAKPKRDRREYMRELMRKRRAKA